MKIFTMLTVLTAMPFLQACGAESDSAIRGQGESREALGDPMAVLGQHLFEDQALSVNGNQSCRTCHEPSQGFAAPLLGVTTQGSVVEGSVPGQFGNRKPPTSAYSTNTPIFNGAVKPTGGIFWDGRATGKVLGNPAADQALGPFLNPAEQALPDFACIAYRIAQAAYFPEYVAVWGPGISAIQFPADTQTVCSTPRDAPGAFVALSSADRAQAETEYHNVALSISAFEATLSRFSSRFDRAELTTREQAGQKLFGGKAKCTQCHSGKVTNALFTDFAFHNLGLPHNPANPVFNYTTNAFDPGLGGFTGRSANLGKFRTPTTRNVGLGDNRTFMHNGVLTSLRQVVDFYNTRDAVRVCTPAEIAVLAPAQYGTLPGAAGCWPPPEYPNGMDTRQMGNLGLTPSEVDSIVEYLMAMTDL